jgi:hypothetical protein
MFYAGDFGNLLDRRFHHIQRLTIFHNPRCMGVPERDDFVTILYSAFFNRDPDPDGKQAWLEALTGSSSREDVLNGFTYALEFENLCHDYGIIPF